MKTRNNRLLLPFILICSLCCTPAVSILAEAKNTVRLRDVKANAYYAEAANWAVEKGLINGFPDGTFRGDEALTFAQAATILWRQAGRPAPEMVIVEETIRSSGWYTDAMQWGHEQNLFNLFNHTNPSPDEKCTRSEAINMLWLNEKAPAPTELKRLFIKEYRFIVSYEPAVLWAESVGIVKGDANGRFNADAPCTRAQFVTFLYRCCQAKGDAKTFYGANGEPLFDFDNTKVTEIRFKNRYTGAEQILHAGDGLYERSLQLLKDVRAYDWVPLEINDFIAIPAEWGDFNPKDGMWYELTLVF